MSITHGQAGDGGYPTEQGVHKEEERKDRDRYSGQATTRLPHVQIYMGKDRARMFCLGYHMRPTGEIKNGKERGRGWVLHVPVHGSLNPMCTTSLLCWCTPPYLIFKFWSV